MTVTAAPEPATSCTVKVPTTAMRQALKAVIAHHKKTRKEADLAQHRIRLTFANGHLFVTASNDDTTGLSKIRYVDDSRGEIWEPADAPLIVDLQPRHVPLITAWVSKKASASDMDQLLAITVDVREGEIEWEDIGGMFSSGERQIYQFGDPNDAFPDVIDISNRAINEAAGKGERHKDLVQQAEILARFAAAGKQYGQQLRIRATGSAESRGFLVQCGPDFIGTVTSRHGDDDGLKTRDKIDHEWRKVLGTKLTAVSNG